MLSINTNLAGLIAQKSLTTSTDKLNQAIERMTTGLKINHASDNAANYSISTNLTTQLSAYDTAADNVAMGMDLVNYASDIISQMQDKAARLNALSTQARSGTYGAQSLSALNSEASAIMSELMRLYSTAEYNDISLFNRTAYTIASHLPQAGESGFIDETAVPANNGEYGDFLVDPKHPNGDVYVEGLTSVAQAMATGTLFNGHEYKVATVDDLKALVRFVNNGNNTSSMTFIMSEDIDLSGEANWTPIGDYSTSSTYAFRGTFDGNGHVIKNLKIDRETSDYQGLFGFVNGGEIKNVGLENVDIKGKNNVGGLVGYTDSFISNSYATGVVSGTQKLGGLAGQASSISNSYATGTVSGNKFVGGLLATIKASNSSSVNISNSVAYSIINADDSLTSGSLVGIFINSDRYSTTDGNLNIINSQSIAQNDINKIGGVYRDDMWDGYFHFTDYDMTTMLAGISDVDFRSVSTNLQVGIYGNDSSSMNFDTNFTFDLNIDAGIESIEAFNAIVAFEKLLSEKATQLGAVQNRLDSALESIEVNINNLTSTRSTIRDADIAEVSSHYIQQQILQQASASLMATANQAPAIALQLI